VVEAGSISGAADRLGVAKSVVSRRITDLEERLGAQLFRRTTRRLNLTDTARGFYDRCLRILADVQEAEDAVSDEHGTLRGRLRVAMPLSFGLMHLGPAIDAFMEKHPKVEFDLDFNDREVDLLAEGFDVGLRIGTLADSSFIARQLATIKGQLCASPTYLEKHGTPRVPEDLRSHACLTYSNLPDPTLWTFVGSDGKETQVRVTSCLMANNGTFLRDAAIAGQGIVLQPNFISYEAIQSGQLVPLLTDHSWPDVHAYALYPQTRHLSRRVRAFVDFLADRFAGVPYWDVQLTPGD
jgi:DNA-binding transcriptional LysR family regulator